MAEPFVGIDTKSVHIWVFALIYVREHTQKPQNKHVSSWPQTCNMCKLQECRLDDSGQSVTKIKR